MSRSRSLASALTARHSARLRDLDCRLCSLNVIAGLAILNVRLGDWAIGYDIRGDDGFINRGWLSNWISRLWPLSWAASITGCDGLGRGQRHCGDGVGRDDGASVVGALGRGYWARGDGVRNNDSFVNRGSWFLGGFSWSASWRWLGRLHWW